MIVGVVGTRATRTWRPSCESSTATRPPWASSLPRSPGSSPSGTDPYRRSPNGRSMRSSPSAATARCSVAPACWPAPRCPSWASTWGASASSPPASVTTCLERSRPRAGRVHPPAAPLPHRPHRRPRRRGGLHAAGPQRRRDPQGRRRARGPRQRDRGRRGGGAVQRRRHRRGHADGVHRLLDERRRPDRAAEHRGHLRDPDLRAHARGPSVVAGADSSIVIAPIEGWAEDLLVSFDGQTGFTLAANARVEVQRSATRSARPVRAPEVLRAAAGEAPLGRPLRARGGAVIAELRIRDLATIDDVTLTLARA